MNLSYPKAWVGYVTGSIALAAFAALLVLRPSENAPYTLLTGTVTVVMAAALLTGVIYWFMSVYRLHKILEEATGGRYPISPRRAVWTQLVPLYNIYWMFRWTREVADFVNHAHGEEVLGRDRHGWMLLGAAFVGRLFTGSYLLIAFSVLASLSSAVRGAIAEKTLPVQYDREKYRSSVPAMLFCAFGGIILIGLAAAVAIPKIVQTRDASAQKQTAPAVAPAAPKEN